MRTLLAALIFIVITAFIPIGVLACPSCSPSTCQVQGQYNYGETIRVYVKLATSSYYYLMIYKPDSTINGTISNLFLFSRYRR